MFLKVDYKELEEALQRQAQCQHNVYEILDVEDMEIKYRPVKIINYNCRECGKDFVVYVPKKKK